MKRTEGPSLAGNKNKRVQTNTRGFSSTQNDRHPLVEAYCTYTKEEPDELTTRILEDLFIAGNADQVPAEYNDAMLGSIHELVTRFKSTPSIYADAGNVPNVMFHTLDPDILTAMVLRELKTATVQTQGQQMADTDNTEIAYKKHLEMVNVHVKTFLAQQGLNERLPSLQQRALAATSMLKEVYEKPAHNLPEMITTAVSTLCNRPLLQQTMKISPPEARHVFELSLQAYLRYLIPYDAAKMHEFYRPCGMKDMCCFIRVDKNAGSLVPIRSAPLVSFWRPGCKSHIDLTLPNLCILCFTLYIEFLYKMGRLRAQDGYLVQAFTVLVGGLSGFPKSYVYMPGMVQEQSRHNAFIGPFPIGSVLLDNLICEKGIYSFRLVASAEETVAPDPVIPKPVGLALPNFS